MRKITQLMLESDGPIFSNRCNFCNLGVARRRQYCLCSKEAFSYPYFQSSLLSEKWFPIHITLNEWGTISRNRGLKMRKHSSTSNSGQTAFAPLNVVHITLAFDSLHPIHLSLRFLRMHWEQFESTSAIKFLHHLDAVYIHLSCRMLAHFGRRLYPP